MKIFWMEVKFQDQPDEPSVFVVVAEDEQTAKKEVTDSVKDVTQPHFISVTKQVSIASPPIIVNVTTNLKDRFKYLQPSDSGNGASTPS